MLIRYSAIILLLLLSSTLCFAKNVIFIEKNIGKEIFQKTENGDTRSTYLGKITDKNQKNRFYVVKEFSRIKAAMVYHGNSWLIFYSPNKKFKARYHFDMPNELPFKLTTNTLYFYDTDEKPVKVLAFKINSRLPKQIFNSSTISFTQ
ncbi:hypothetical protein BCL90_1534 [Pedobacter alluvionis]|uniref:Uncharacterized protein n=1 Tax=Pedobacter alluvionis TaxID=475253 RepID=A0A497YC00_9SPHI|nr:hypothetical protein BCL90_1534 [Pedobacter alluvionis]